MTSDGERYILRCTSCGTLVMRVDKPRKCPACECTTVKFRHRKKDGYTAFRNVTEVIV